MPRVANRIFNCISLNTPFEIFDIVLDSAYIRAWYLNSYDPRRKRVDYTLINVVLSRGYVLALSIEGYAING